ncbi:MAG: PKD domain-containing protein [Planctomycetota bacterium]|nr:PKD domain-containing protein [Planctomycetota bacterium]
MQKNRENIWLLLLVFVFLVSLFSCSSEYAKSEKIKPYFQPSRSLEQVPGVEPIMAGIAREDENSIEIIYKIPGCELRTIDATSQAKRIFVGNAYHYDAEPGKPAMPVIPSLVMLPKGRTVDAVRVSLGEKASLMGEHFIEVSQQPYPISWTGDKSETQPDNNIYGSNNPYPEKPYQFLGVQRRRGVAFALVNLFPVVYRPLSGKVEYYKTISLKIVTRLERPDESSPLNYRPDPVRPLTDRVENPNTLATYEKKPSSGMVGGIIPGGCNPAESYQYVVVTSKDIINANTTPKLENFLSFKRSKGLTATAVAIEDIYTVYSGIDNAEKLRNFIIDAYNNWETDYILLGGDTNIIPCRKLWGESLRDDHIPSDLYFECLEGPYNYNGNNRWGEKNDGTNGKEIDIFADVYVGRASAENATEFSNFVYKTIAYETQHQSDSHLRTALMLGEYLGFQGDAEYATAAMEEIRLGCGSTKGFKSCSTGKVDTMYESDNETWYKSDLLNKINANTYSIINHMGHGQHDSAMKLKNSDDALLKNTKFFFVNSQACFPGAFDSDCLAEHLTTSTQNGCFAVVMNSREGILDRNGTNGPSQLFQRYFWHALFGKKISQLGAMLADMRYERRWSLVGCNRWVYFEITLFGDPELKLRYTEPPTPPPPTAPVAAFSASPLTGTVPLTVQFKDESTGNITSWAWDLNNDGALDSTERNPVHTYTSAGTYSVTLTVTGPGGTNKATKQNYIVVNNPPAPVADFSFSPSSGLVPLTVQFTDNSTGNIISWAWDFNGDGNSDSTEKNPSYTYTKAGVYTVSLTVTGTGGSSTKTKTDCISVYTPTPPVASFYGTPTSGIAPLAVQFVDESTGTIDSWQWDLNGDGIPDTNAKNPIHIYTTPGVYTITLTVSGAAGSNTCVKQDYIKVDAPPPPAAEFSATPLSGNAPLTVQFKDESTGKIDSWLWDFGDGTTSSLQKPSHTYTSEGTYTVTLTVTNMSGSDTKTKYNYITVVKPPVNELTAVNITGTILKSSWKRNCGWRFVCKSDITITKVMFYGTYASTVTIWDDNGNLLASVNVQGGTNWPATELTTKVALKAGQAYRIAVYTPTDYWYAETGNYTPSADITITHGCYGAWESTGFPSILPTWGIFGLVNFKYTK